MGKETAKEILNDQVDSLTRTEEIDPKLLDARKFCYYHDEKNRVIWLDSDVEEDTMYIVRLILHYNQVDRDVPIEDRKPIKLLIRTYGGDGQVCFSLIDTILMSKTPVYTINMGLAMSAGLLILLAGHKRYCLPRSSALVHSGSGKTGGTFEQTEAQMQDYKHFIEMMRTFIVQRSSVTKQTLLKKQTKEWYLYADEQVELHIVDGIVDDIDLLL